MKAANVTEATNMGIHTNPMPQHQGSRMKLRNLHRYKLIQDLLPALTPSELALPLEERCLPPQVL